MLLTNPKGFANWAIRRRPYCVCVLCFLFSSSITVATITRTLGEIPSGRGVIQRLQGKDG